MGKSKENREKGALWNAPERRLAPTFGPLGAALDGVVAGDGHGLGGVDA
jgi:hypothetical protein